MPTAVVFRESTDPETKCAGCRTCELACAARNGAASVNPRWARIHVVLNSRENPVPLVCRHCGKPPCVPACSEGALHVNFHRVLLDAQRCTGCGDCVNACPFHAIRINLATRKLLICDLCDGDPRCVHYCPQNVLHVSR